MGAFEKSRKVTITSVVSVRPHGTTRLPMPGFSWHSISEYFFKGNKETAEEEGEEEGYYFSKICRENSSLIKIWQE